MKNYDLIVIGGGPIGLELAQSFARFGSEMMVLETTATIFGMEDEEIIPVIKKPLEQEMTFHFNAMVKKVHEENGKKMITYESNSDEVNIEADAILMATGRTPNTDDMNLEDIGVDVDDRGHIVVNDYLQTSQSHIYAVGDSDGQFPFTHAADWMQEMVFSKTKGHKISEISNVIHSYPTHGEIVSESADQYWMDKLFDGVLPKLSKKYIQWFR